MRISLGWERQDEGGQQSPLRLWQEERSGAMSERDVTGYDLEVGLCARAVRELFQERDAVIAGLADARVERD